MAGAVTQPDRRELLAALDALAADVVEADARPGSSPEPDRADSLRVTIAWAGEEPLLRGRAYDLRLGEGSVVATVAPLKYRLDLQTGEHVAATALARDEIGVCDLELSEPLPFVPYRVDRDAGTFTLVDRISGATVGVGLVQFALRRASNVVWQPLTIDKGARAGRLGQRPTVLWLTGLSGAGKSTIANLVESELHRRGHHTYMLDGDNVRHGLNADLGFTEADRVENIRRVGEVARLMVDAGLIVIVSFISPFRAERSMARSLLEPGEFIEIHVDTPLAVAEERDPKGLYRKARRGELANFTGIDSPYEPPLDPEIRLDTTALSPAEAAAAVIAALETAERLRPPDSSPRG
jgi:bifunctional enzyme CysN/CysC